MTLKNIAWLASYPKSGNTWTRAFLINYLFNTPTPMPINQIHRLGMGDAVTKSYEMVADGKFDPRNYHKVLRLRPKVIHGIAANEADLNFVKTHNINDFAFQTRLIPREYTRSAIYILRNPLDIVLSYARHYGLDADGAIKGIGRTDNTTSGSSKSVKMFLGTWSDHVKSWVDCKDFPVHVTRYEDMVENPTQAFGDVLSFLGIPLDQERLARAIKHASFEELSKQEEKTEFIERSDNSAKFFHTGRSGQWKTDLTEAQVERVRSDHAKVMERFGYL